MKELSASKVTIQDPFWSPKLEINAKVSIFHQWDELEKCGCIDNFRIVAGEKEGFREGWVFADSDAYKWLDAAARIYANVPDPKLKSLMDELIRLLAKTQMADGYIYTYNQFHFPGQRWVNMQIEHELYCLGHMIEAAVSHHDATGETSALEIATKAADLLVREFLDGPPEKTEGHEEIEIALLRLVQVTGKSTYLDLAEHFIEVRGRIKQYASLYQAELTSYEARKAFVRQEREKYAASHAEYAISKIPPDNEAKIPPRSKFRRKVDALSGRHTQQHAPVRKQTVPVGHAVRFGYFETATTLLHRLRGDQTLLPTLEKAWERMVTRRMYVTGGLGSLPGNEGFGNDYELDPEYAYAETCAALASLFWNWEMALATGNARYSDLFEWQLYNAAAVGVGTGGNTYLYNNPLLVRGGIQRRSWYSVPCCPPNLSRTWASLGKYIYFWDDENIWIHQYFGNQAALGISIKSGLPFTGSVTIDLGLPTAKTFTLHLRLPSWSTKPKVKVNDEEIETGSAPLASAPTAQGYDPRQSRFIPICREWQPGDQVELTFDTPIVLRTAHPKVKGHTGKVALTRGPLVYCLESIDNLGVDIFTARLDPSTLAETFDSNLLGGILKITAKTTGNQNLTFIPYHLWGNRGPSQMVVWVNSR
jgi:DUF1680 family protein